MPRLEAVNAPDDHESFGLLVRRRSPDQNVELRQDVMIPNAVRRVADLEDSRLARIAVIVAEIRVRERRRRLAHNDALDANEISVWEREKW